MVDCFKICYVARYPNGSLLDSSKPYLEANVLASSKKEAISNLMMEFPGLKITVVEDPVHAEVELH